MGGDTALAGAPGPSNQRTRRFLGPVGTEGALHGLLPISSKCIEQTTSVISDNLAQGLSSPF